MCNEGTCIACKTCDEATIEKISDSRDIIYMRQLEDDILACHQILDDVDVPSLDTQDRKLTLRERVDRYVESTKAIIAELEADLLICRNRKESRPIV